MDFYEHQQGKDYWRFDWTSVMNTRNKLDYILSPEGIARSVLVRNKLDKALCLFDYLKSKGYTFLGEGRTRIGFRSPNGQWVVKIARDDDGVYHNFRERSVWREGNRNRLARCKSFMGADGYILVMEYVESVPNKEKPHWGRYDIDCGQVGRNRKGAIVAYDYGG